MPFLKPWSTSATAALRVASDTGPRDAPAVVMLHGIASSSVTFTALMPHLFRHRAVALELLGFGRSEAPPAATFTIDEHAAALAAAISGLRLSDGFVLVGHSLGALVVSRYAATAPEGLSAVVLVSPPIYVPPSVLPDGAARTAMALYLRSFDYLRANKAFTMRLARFIGRLVRIPGMLEVNDKNWRAFEGSLRNSIETQTTVADIASTRVPVEIVYGTLDPFVVPEVVRLVGSLRQVAVRRVAHSSHIVDASIAAAVGEAIERHSPRSSS